MRLKSINKTRILAFSSLILASSLFTPGSSLAQSFSLSLTPSIVSVNLPYDSSTKSVPLTLRNTSEDTLRLRIEILPIKEIDKLTERPVYQSMSTLSSEQQSFYKTAIEYEQNGRKVSEIVLSPKQTTEVLVNINNNTYQNASEYYFSLGLIENSAGLEKSVESDEAAASANIQPGVATHFLVSTGTGSSDVKITSLKKQSGVSDTLPPFVLSVQNDSGRHTRIYGNISIYNILGQKLAEYPVDSYLLADQDKALTVSSFKEAEGVKFSLGPKSSKLKLSDEASGKTYEKEIYYLGASNRTLAISVLVLIFILYIARRVMKKASRG